MSWYYPYGFRWFQDGGSVLPGTMLSPWEVGRYMARGWYQDGGGVGWPAGVPSPREVAMAAALQRAFAPVQGSPSQNEVKKKEEPKKKRIIPPPAEPRVRGDLPMNFGLPTQDQVADLINQKVAEQQRLQGQLERVGYKGAYAAAMSRQGRGKLPENVQEQLDNQEASDYRVKHHPDYDPSRPVEDQQDLNYDNSFRTTVLRGANMFTDSGDPVMDFVAGAATGAGRSFANIVLDAPNRYVNPIVQGGWRGVPQAVGNLGMDAMGLATTNAVGNRIASRLVSRGLPEASVAMEQTIASAPSISARELREAAYDYYERTKDPRYLERVRALDKELGMDGELERRLQLFHQQGEEDLGKELPFNMRIEQPRDSRAFGSSRVIDHTVSKFSNKTEVAPAVAVAVAKPIDISKLSEKEIKKLFPDMYDKPVSRGKSLTPYYTPQQREVLIAPDIKSRGVSPQTVVNHELKHHMFNALRDREGDIQNYSKWLESVVSEDLRKPVLLKDIGKKRLRFISNEDLSYVADGTELDAFLTNMRDDMVRQGYLKDHFDILTNDKLDAFIRRNQFANLANKAMKKRPPSQSVNYYFRPFSNVIKDRDRFLEVFNKALPVATGVGVGLGVMGAAEEQKKWGGEKRMMKGGRVPGMPMIGIRRGMI